MSAVPEWAAPAVAAWWTWFDADHRQFFYDTIRREVKGGSFVVLFDDGSGHVRDGQRQDYSALVGPKPKSIPDSLKLADEYAESVGGWA